MVVCCCLVMFGGCWCDVSKRKRRQIVLVSRGARMEGVKLKKKGWAQGCGELAGTVGKLLKGT